MCTVYLYTLSPSLKITGRGRYFHFIPEVELTIWKVEELVFESWFFDWGSSYYATCFTTTPRKSLVQKHSIFPLVKPILMANTWNQTYLSQDLQFTRVLL